MSFCFLLLSESKGSAQGSSISGFGKGCCFGVNKDFDRRMLSILEASYLLYGVSFSLNLSSQSLSLIFLLAFVLMVNNSSSFSF